MHTVVAPFLAVAAIVAILGLCAGPVLGQTSANGSIRGVVRDPQHAVLPNTTITAASPTMPVPVIAATDGEGYYRLLDLPPGEYELMAERQGFATSVRPGVVVRAGLNLLVDIDMRLSAESVTITVEAETPMLESSSAVQAINVSGELQRHVPLTTRRDWSESLLLAPGVIAVPSAGRRVETALDLFNVTNHDAFHLIEQGGSQTFSPLYGQGRQRQTPRAAQISVRLVF